MIRRCVALGQRVRASQVYVLLAAWLMATTAHPLTRRWLNACRRGFAFLIGEQFEDEREAFSKQRLMVNDSYRDRLLAAEIADLVDLCEALQLSIPQHKAFFRCFLHLDYTRRAGVSRSELLRYCGLRDTPAARFLLPGNDIFAVAASAHRSDVFRTQRWDVLQLLALMFSLCTMEPVTLIDLCVQDITARANANEISPTGIEWDNDGESMVFRDEKPEIKLRNRLLREIEKCLIFSSGVPNAVETNLAAFLCRLYAPSQYGKVDFVTIHRVESLTSVITLFPVLLYPCVWIQRVIKRRVLEEATWRKLALRRVDLRLAGLSKGYHSASDIVTASNAHQDLRRRHSRGEEGHKPITAGPPDHCQGRLTTPRKVLPVGETTSQTEQARQPHASLDAYQNQDEAWRATADSVLATVFVWRYWEGPHGLTTQDATVVFEQTRDQIQLQTLSRADVATIQRHLIQEFGYQFTTFMFAKSSLRERSGDLVCSANVQKDVRRAMQRLRKADEGIPLVEDNAVYWQEYTDPVMKRVFYHNIRTGESRWETPSTVLAKRGRKKGARSPAKSPTLKPRQFL